jgi:hypothetical protein
MFADPSQRERLERIISKMAAKAMAVERAAGKPGAAAGVGPGSAARVSIPFIQC